MIHFIQIRNSLFTVLALCFFCGNTKAQLTTSTALTPALMVQNVLLGGGISATGITYVGSPAARGTFNGVSSNIGFASGILLTSGDLTNAIGPNNIGSAAMSVTNPSFCETNAQAAVYQLPCTFLLESTNLFASTSAGTIVVFGLGWRDQVNAN